MSEVLIRVQPTPNPAAWKFIINQPVLNEGKASFMSLEQAKGLTLAEDLLKIDGVKQVHFFKNVITITHRVDVQFDELQENVSAVVRTRMPIHNPDFNLKEIEKDNRKDLPQEVQDIEGILDNTVRPALQADGGDLKVLKYENNQLFVHYEGACGSCPSATTGTLMAIEGILQDQFNPDIQVFPV